MKKNLFKLSFFLTFIIFFLKYANLFAGEIGVDLYGISYHYDKDMYFNKDERSRKHLEEINPGIGIRYNFFENDYLIFGIITGIYDNSEEVLTKYLGLSNKVKIYKGLSCGIDFAFFDTKSYDQRFFPVPTITFRYKQIALNFVWMPDPYTPAVALYGTVFTVKW
jgi:hypothetical protein